MEYYFYDDRKNVNEAITFCNKLTGQAQHPGRMFAYVSKLNNEITGAIIWSNDTTNNYHYNLLKENGITNINKEALIHQIAVKEEYQNKGLSKELLDLFENKCKEQEVDIITLSTITGGKRMYKFLYKNGFTKIIQRTTIKEMKLDDVIKTLLFDFLEEIKATRRELLTAGLGLARKVFEVHRFQPIGLMIVGDKVQLQGLNKKLEGSSPFKLLNKKAPEEIIDDCLNLKYETFIKKVEEIFGQKIH